MADKTKTILVSDLKVGDTIRITHDIVVDDITDLNKTKPTVTKKLKLIKATAASGGWRDAKGEFVISDTEKIELIKRHKPDSMWKRVIQELGIYTFGSGAVILGALAVAHYSV